MNTPKATCWWWVRHAPVINQKGIIYGQRDVPCDTSDVEKFQALAKALPRDAVWVTSHLSRTRETASAIAAQGLELSDILIEKDLAEQRFGDWEGKTWNDFNLETNAVYGAFWKDAGRSIPPGGESFERVCHRVARVIRRINAEHAGSQIVAVAHGGSVRAAVAMALGLAPDKALAVKVDTLSLTRLDFIATEGEHVSHGLRAGLEGAWQVVGVNMPVV